MLTRILICGAIAATLSGCVFFDAFDDDNDNGSSSRCAPVEESPVELGSPTASERTYLLDTIDLPGNASEATQFGFDLDRDKIPDNALGNIASAVAQIGGGDVEGAANEAIEAGQLLHLLTVVEDRNSPQAGIVVVHGDDLDGDPGDNLSGDETFGIDRARGSGSISGMINNGVLTASGGQLPIALAIPGHPRVYPLRLDVAQIRVTVTDDGLEGFIGGAIPDNVVRDSFIPFLADSLQVTVDRDCEQGVCEPNSFGELMLDVFDDNTDGIIAAEELRESSVIAGLFAPDVDVRRMDSEDDPGGEIAINCDGVEDSLSIGFRFTAVPAAIQ